MQIQNPFEEIVERLSNIENCLLELKQESKQFSNSDKDQWFDLKELCDYLPDKPSKMTVYGWVHDQSIPHRKGAKKLRFLKSEIDTWLKCGKKVSIVPDHETIPEYLLKAKGDRK